MTTDTTTPAAQRDFCDQMVYAVARTWSGTMPADMADRYESYDARLNGVVHSLFTELQGEGGLNPHRLSPNRAPDVDLLDLPWSLEHAYPVTEEQRFTLEPGVAVDLLRAIDEEANEAIGWAYVTKPPYAEVIGDFLHRVCLLFERGYRLRSVFIDEDGDVVGEGKDIAPGLSAAFAATWERAHGRPPTQGG